MSSLSRRQWIGGALALGTSLKAQLRTSPFTLGVASGDPLPDGVVLWTRLMAPELSGDLEVTWEVAEDDAMRHVVKRGRTLVGPLFGHSVHIEVGGLKPARWYYYRFRAGGADSVIGRTRTAPKAGSQLDKLRFAVASCQRYDDGFYTAYQHMAKEDIELVLFLGDYIYEYGQRSGTVRAHTGAEIKSLSDYRARYALYRSDPLLQEAHRLFPWISVWDDHEVQNNWAGDFPSWQTPDPQFLERRANAAQAFYENTPLRRSSIPKGSSLQVYRRFDYGDLARFHMLDTRLYRSRQGCMDGIKLCPENSTPGRSILGAAQQKWLYDGLATSRSQWDVLGNQVIMTQLDLDPGPDQAWAMDDWNGYPESRRGLLNMLEQRKKPGVLVVTGDNHHHMAGDIYPGEPLGTPVATELVGTSISSGGDGNVANAFNGRMKAAIAGSPQVHYYEDRRGYVVCSLDREQCTADFRELEYVSRTGSGLREGARFHIDRKQPGAQRA